MITGQKKGSNCLYHSETTTQQLLRMTHLHSCHLKRGNKCLLCLKWHNICRACLWYKQPLRCFVSRQISHIWIHAIIIWPALILNQGSSTMPSKGGLQSSALTVRPAEEQPLKFCWISSGNSRGGWTAWAYLMILRYFIWSILGHSLVSRSEDLQIQERWNAYLILSHRLLAPLLCSPLFFTPLSLPLHLLSHNCSYICWSSHRGLRGDDTKSKDFAENICVWSPRSPHPTVGRD